MSERKLKLFFYKESEHFTLPDEFPALPEIPLMNRVSKDHECLDGLFDTTDDPAEADYIIFPYQLGPAVFPVRTMVMHFYIKSLPYFYEYEAKHVFHLSHDKGQPFCTDALIFTNDARKSNVDDGNVFAFPHFPKPHVLAKAPDYQFDKIKYDVCFVGTLSDPSRIAAIQSIESCPDLKYFLRYPNTTDWSDKETSYLHMDDEDKKRQLEELYVNNLRKSWTVLCPRGMGSSSIRFFETLSMGRIPIHISDEYPFPFADEIDYSRFCINVPESASPIIGKVVSGWINKKTPEELEAICREARAVWEKYFNVDEAKQVMLRFLKLHKATPGPVKGMDKYVPIEKETGEGVRMGYVEGFFNNMEIDNREVWINRPLQFGKAPIDDSGIMNQCNGVNCYLASQDVQFLYTMASQAPNNAAILEIGSWMGASGISMASALMATRNLGAKVYCVDTWLGSPEHQDFDFIQKDQMYQEFLENGRGARANLLIEPVRMPSLEASKHFKDNSLDLLFVDGDHCYKECLADCEAWYPKVKPGGIILGHDYWSDTKNEVYEAAQEFSRRYGLELIEPEGLRFFVFKKPAVQSNVA